MGQGRPASPRIAAAGAAPAGLWVGAALLTGWLAFGAARAATIEVTTNLDQWNNGGNCSLREALDQIRQGRDGRGCTNTGAAYGTNDTIVLPAETYRLTRSGTDRSGGDLDVERAVTLQGAGGNSAGTLIDGSGLPGPISAHTNVIEVHTGVTATFMDIQIQGGRTNGDYRGAGVHNNGTLTLSRCAVVNNTGSSQAAGGTGNFGTMTVQSSYIGANRNAFGEVGSGSDNNRGTLAVLNSTYSANGNSGSGAALYHYDDGPSTGSASVSFTTFEGNTLSLTADQDPVTVTASILNNGCTAVATDGGPLGSIVDSGYNTDAGTTCGLTASTSRSSTPVSLTATALNGGTTLNHLIAQGSPAYNRIPPGALGCGTTVNTDQRGSPRPGALLCDLGSVEIAPADAFDFGDAPASYGDVAHLVADPPPLYLGAVAPDGEATTLYSPGADADDNTAVDDEDGAASVPGAATGDGRYTLSVTYLNQAGSNARLCGWVDFDQGGSFDGDERACVTLTPGIGPAAVDLELQVPLEDRNRSGDLYARLRIASVAAEAEAPTGTAANGEVEDYRLTVTTLPVTLANVVARLTPQGIQVAWTTATETRNAGFHVYGRPAGEASWRRLTERLIPSRVVDSLEPQGYGVRFPDLALDEVLIEDWDTSGRSARHGPFAVGTVHGFDAAAGDAPIDWAGIRGANARRDAPRLRPETAPRTGGPETLLWVEAPGIQRVSFADLQSAGADYAGIPIDELALTDDGKAQARHVIDANGNGAFDPGDSVEFVGVITRTLYSARNAYRLHQDPTRRQVRRARSKRLDPTGAAQGAFRDLVTVEGQHAYSYSSPTDDPWYDAWLFANGGPSRLERPFDLPGYAGGAVRLDLRLWGVTDWPSPGPDHHLIVRVNGELVDELWFDGRAAIACPVTLPQDRVLERGNLLTLEAPGDTGFDYDIQALDGFNVHYERLTRAEGGAWRGTIPPGVEGRFRVDGFLGESVAWRGAQRRVGGATLALSGSGAWTAADARAIHRPAIQVEVPIGAPIPAPGSLDYLIISHRQFIGTAAMEDLVALQGARGYRTRLVDVAEVYAAYSDFEVSAEAIRRFIAGARPRFVLLVGGDSYDYQDYLGLGSQSFIPTHYLPTDATVTYAPADSRHADHDGDGLPDAATGRLPVRTEAELTRLVAKLLSYAPPVQAVLSAGPSDQGRGFADLNGGYGSHLPGDLFREEIAVDDLGLDEARSRLLDSLGGPGALVSYVGHSSYGIWGLNPRHGILLSAGQARDLPNSNPHLITQWGCWNTYFVNPRQDTMANGFLLQDRGAAAVLGATALTDIGLLRGLGDYFFRHFGSTPTLGEALLAAQRDYAADRRGAAAALAGFALLGDPAAELRP